MPKHVRGKERQDIVDMLHEHGGNRSKVAKLSGRGPATIQRIAEAEGIKSEHSALKKANEARRVFAEAERREIVVDGLLKAKAMLQRIEDAGELQKWSVAVGTLVDKDLLLSGKPTSINESRKGDIRDVFSDLDRKFGITS